MLFYALQVNGKKILSLKQYMEEPTSISLVGKSIPDYIYYDFFMFRVPKSPVVNTKGYINVFDFSVVSLVVFCFCAGTG